MLGFSITGSGMDEPTPGVIEPTATHVALYNDGRAEITFVYEDPALNKKVNLSAIQMKVTWMAYNTIREIFNGRRDFSEPIGTTDTPQSPGHGGTTSLGE